MIRRIIALFLTCCCAFGQDEPPTRVERIMENASNLRVTITLDRSVYIIGEVGVAIVTITNPTSQPLEIPKPESNEASALDLCSKKSPYVVDLGLDWGCRDDLDIKDDIQSRMIRPFESVTFRIRSDDKHGANNSSWIGGGTMGDTPGPRLLRYRLGGLSLAEIQFPVIAPILETWTAAVLKKKAQYEGDRGEVLYAPHKVHVIAAQMGQEHVILVAKTNLTCKCDPKADQSGKLVRATGRPFFRVATLAQPIVRMSATTDAKDVIAIEYTTADGHTGVIHLNEKREREKVD